MRTPWVVLLLAATSGLPSALQGQALDGVMAAVRNGGGWVSIDIVKGRGSASTLPLPTMGMNLQGCVRVFDGHSGRWRIRARDMIAGDTIEVSSIPGQGVPFAHEFGLRTQLEVEFIWSEPRDTTLFLWVGVGDAVADPSVCTPKGPGV